MEKIQCDKCGADNFSSSKYCSSCGYELPKTVVEEVPQGKPVKSKKKLTKAELITLLVAVTVASITSVFVQNIFFSKPDIDKMLVETASTLNKTFPMMVDADTRVDNVIALPNKTFMYNYTLVNDESGMIDTVEVKNYLTPKIINTVKTTPGMKSFRDNKVTMEYCYKDKNGNYVFSIIVTPEQYK